MRVASTVLMELDAPTAFASLAAVHEARRLLTEGGAGREALLDALASLERELGLAIGAERARAFLRQRSRRRATGKG